MAAAAVIGLSSSGKRILSTSIYSSELNEKPYAVTDHGTKQYPSTASRARVIVFAKRGSNFSSGHSSNKHKQAIRAVKEQRDVAFLPSTVDSLVRRSGMLEEQDESSTDTESLLEARVQLQKSMLEKQWNLPYNHDLEPTLPKEIPSAEIISSESSARQRRKRTQKKHSDGDPAVLSSNKQRQLTSTLETQKKSTKRRSKGKASELLGHDEIARLCTIIKAGVSIEDDRKRIEKMLGYNLSDEELASSLNLSYTELKTRLLEYSLAREKLVTRNIRLVVSIAKKYAGKGADMDDLIQAGLKGLSRGVEKFDSSKGFRFSTYVYWWIRQGITKALFEFKAVGVPMHIYQRLYSIKKAQITLENQGISPTTQNVAKFLNISEQKVLNAMQSVKHVYSLESYASSSVDGVPADYIDNYIADTRPENDPQNEVEKSYCKEEVSKLLSTVLSKRDEAIIRLYHGLDGEFLSWDDIGRRFGLSRERVRQVGLVAVEKLRNEARRRRLDAFLVGV